MWTRSINQETNSDLAKWIVIIIALGTIIFNTITLHNDVQHLKKNQERIITEISELKNVLIDKR